jgi:hypothetical protein
VVSLGVVISTSVCLGDPGDQEGVSVTRRRTLEKGRSLCVVLHGSAAIMMMAATAARAAAAIVRLRVHWSARGLAELQGTRREGRILRIYGIDLTQRWSHRPNRRRTMCMTCR